MCRLFFTSTYSKIIVEIYVLRDLRRAVCRSGVFKLEADVFKS